MRRNLIVVRAGEASLHPEWDDGTPRNFDLFVSYYHTDIEFFEDGSEYQHRLEGPVWRGNAEVCRAYEELLAAYDFVAFASDDVATTYADLNRLFVICGEAGLCLATPAVTGYATPDLAPVATTLLRYTDRCDIIFPVFSHAALGRLVHTFKESQSGWGLPYRWAQLCTYPIYPTAIVDSVVLRHTRPLGEGKPQAGGVDPLMEQQRIFAEYKLQPAPRRFYSEVPLVPSG